MEYGEEEFTFPSKRGREDDEESELFVGSLSFKASEDDIYDLFGKFGEVSNVKLLKDYDGRSRGRAFVKLSTSKEAAAGLTLNG